MSDKPKTGHDGAKAPGRPGKGRPPLRLVIFGDISEIGMTIEDVIRACETLTRPPPGQQN